MKTTTLFLIAIFFSLNLFAQYSLDNAHLYQTHDNTLFNPPLGTHAQAGPDYGCLSSFTKRPVWLLLTTCGGDSIGSISFNINWNHANGIFDSVGVIVWGPFDDTTNIANKLSSSNTLSCGIIDSNGTAIHLDSLQYPKIYCVLLTVADAITDLNLSSNGYTTFYDGRCGLCHSRVTNYQQDICMVTVDTVSQKNMIVWEKQNNYGNESFNIYREGIFVGQFDSIGNVPFSNSGEFIDMTVNPNQKTYRYTMSGRDSCGAAALVFDDYYGFGALIHKTIHLAASPGLSGEVNLAWNDYVGFNYNIFYIYRGSSPTNMQVLDSVAYNAFSYTDYSAQPGLNYYRVTVRNVAGCSPDGGTTTYYNARSNNPYTNVVGIDEVSASASIKITPNPSRGLLKISLDKNIKQGEVNIFNAIGQQVYFQSFTGKEKTVNTKLSEGIYFVQVSGGGEVFVQKVVVE